MDGAHWVSAGGASLARWRLPAALSPTIQQVAVWGQPTRPATDIKDHPVMTQKEEDAPSTATIDRLGSSLPQRTNGVPEGPDYIMDVGRTKLGINSVATRAYIRLRSVDSLPDRVED